MGNVYPAMICEYVYDKMFRESYPAPHCGQKGEQGGSAPRDACSGDLGEREVGFIKRLKEKPHLTREVRRDADGKVAGIDWFHDDGKGGRRKATDAEIKVIARLKRMKINIPPGAKNVWVPLTPPEGKIQARSVGGTGRAVAYYGKAHHTRQLARKHDRIPELVEDKLPKAVKQWQKIERTARDPEKREAAVVLQVLEKTGLRVGNPAILGQTYTRFEKGHKKAGKLTGESIETFGISSLRSRHVKLHANNVVELDYAAKGGKRFNMKYRSKELTRLFEPRMKGKGKDDPVFSLPNKSAITDVKNQTLGKRYKIHDIRAGFTTRQAQRIVSEMPEPTTMKEFKKARKEVGLKIGEMIGDTPGMTLKAYVVPTVFQQWEDSALRGRETKKKKTREAAMEPLDPDEWDPKHEKLVGMLRSYVFGWEGDESIADGPEDYEEGDELPFADFNADWDAE